MRSQRKKNYVIHDIYTAMIKAHEIQGMLALNNSFNQVGLDHVVLVKVATTALATFLLGGQHTQVCNAISNAWIDGQSLRTYRHSPNTGSRKSWAAGDATSRGVRLALLAMQGEMGYPSALTAAKWGFYDVCFQGKSFVMPQHFGSYVMEHILFKAAFPAEFHAQTAVECAFKLQPQVSHRLEDIVSIKVETQEAGMRIINKQGPLYNPADRDHCLQYMIAIPLIYGELTAEHYEDEIAQNPLIDRLRACMQINENLEFSKDYLDPQKRSIANSVQIIFKDGSQTDKITVEYPVGHPKRRVEALPLILSKFRSAVTQHYSSQQANKIIEICTEPEKLANTPVDELTDLLAL